MIVILNIRAKKRLIRTDCMSEKIAYGEVVDGFIHPFFIRWLMWLNPIKSKKEEGGNAMFYDGRRRKD